MITGIERVAGKAKRDSNCCFTSIAHHVTESLLRDRMRAINRSTAPGVDGKTKEESEKVFKDWISTTLDQVHRRGYRPPPVKRVLIPKPGRNTKRPLGIPTILDRCLQGGVAKVLEAIYEQDFLDQSFGGRPRKNAHQAIATLNGAINRKRVSWIYEADLKNFFGSLDHDKVIEFFEHRIKDPRIITLLRRWLKAGVMEEGTLQRTEHGAPQGGPISVLISNVYLHYTLDLWIEKVVKPRMRGEVYYVRYMDDFILAFQNCTDAKRFEAALEKRLSKFTLKLEASKTRMLRFGRYAYQGSTDRGETFSFLGFTFYRTTTKDGRFFVGCKTEKTRLKRTMVNLKELTLGIRHLPVKVQASRINLTLNGHYRHYGIGGNFLAIQKVYRQTIRLWLKALQSRTQRHNLTWDKYNLILKANRISRPKLFQPYSKLKLLANL